MGIRNSYADNITPKYACCRPCSSESDAPGTSSSSPAVRRNGGQASIDLFLNRPVTLNLSKKITQLITNVIVGDLWPINLVEGHHFRQLINALVPGYSMPSRTNFTQRVEDSFLQAKQVIKTRLKTCKALTLTTDLWSSCTMQSYLGVTAHFIDVEVPDFKLCNLVLATKEVLQSHTGDNLAAWLEAILLDYEIAPAQVIATVTDNSTNMVSACSDLNEKYRWVEVRCLTHKLQLCVKDGLDISQVKRAIGKMEVMGSKPVV